MIPSSLLQGLNARQKEAVETLEGPLLILAGAGSGKTRVLTHRMAALVATGSARPDQILAVTFTNKAAREMRDRAEALLRSLGFAGEQDLWISTFHSSCVRILRRNAELLEYPSFFGIYDASESLSVIKRALVQMNLDEKIHPAKSFQGRISNAKMLGLLPGDLHQGASMGFRMDPTSLAVYEAYERELKASNNMDFDDLLLKTHQLFADYPAILEQYQQKFRYIMIDEYQDTNHIQYKLVSLLARGHHNLCVVGDEDQSIYSWRGADISNILSFEKDFPDAKVVKLEQNYRSTQTIVSAASHVIRNNNQRKDKVLFTENEKGNPIIVVEEGNEYDEARFVANSIEKLLGGGELAASDFAVFYRTNAQSRVLEEQLRTRSIPYRLVGGLRFYDRLEIKDIVSYMKLAVNPADNVAFRRVINSPTRGLGKTTLEKLAELSDAWGLPLLQASARAADQREFHSGVCRKLRGFCDLVANLSAQAHTLSPLDFYHLVLDQTQYVQRLREEKTDEAQARIDNLEELDNAISEFEKERAETPSVTAFLEEMALVSDLDGTDTSESAVTLMTLHVSKGLEFPHVYIVGMEEGIFPTLRAMDKSDGDALEEERRLAYVGMTRARRQLNLSYCRSRRLWGQEQHNAPSRFLDEIPSEYVQIKTAFNKPKFMSGWTATDSWSRPPREAVERNSYRETFDFDQSESWREEGINPGAQLARGCRVRHPTYGLGSVYALEGSGEAQKVSVLFDDRSLKKFVTKYARLERV